MKYIADLPVPPGFALSSDEDGKPAPCFHCFSWTGLDHRPFMRCKELLAYVAVHRLAALGDQEAVQFIEAHMPPEEKKP
jgi:hypothetical protein